MQSAAAPAIADADQPQHLRALAHANEIRLARAGVKRQLAAGQLSLRAALEHQACATARVSAVLLAIPRLGPIKVGRILAVAEISPAKLAGGLTARQLDRVVAAVAGDELPLAWPTSEISEEVDVDLSIEGLLA